VDGSTQRGKLAVGGTRYSVASIDPKPTQRWVNYPPATGNPIPQCSSTSLSPQEKALIFMLFDLTNCLTPIVG